LRIGGLRFFPLPGVRYRADRSRDALHRRPEAQLSPSVTGIGSFPPAAIGAGHPWLHTIDLTSLHPCPVQRLCTGRVPPLGAGVLRAHVGPSRGVLAPHRPRCLALASRPSPDAKPLATPPSIPQQCGQVPGTFDIWPRCNAAVRCIAPPPYCAWQLSSSCVTRAWLFRPLSTPEAGATSPSWGSWPSPLSKQHLSSVAVESSPETRALPRQL